MGLSNPNNNVNIRLKDYPQARVDTVAVLNPDRIINGDPTRIVKYIDIGNVNQGQIMQYQEMPLHDAPSRAQRIAKTNDIIISTVRPGNKAYAFFKSIPDNVVISTGFAVIRTDGCDPRYLYYYLTSEPVICYLASIADSKSAYPSINPSDIGEIEIPLPPLETQKEIAHILGTLDDKIELNRKMNKTLEEIAQTLFKHWFIDFEFPNEEGKPYRSSGGEMVDSELGPIPKGWNIGNLGDILTFTNDTAHPNDCLDAKYIGLEHINKNSFTLNGFGKASDTVSLKRVFRKGDILFGKLRPYLKKIVRAPFDGVCSTDIWVIRPSVALFYSYLFRVVSTQQFVDFASQGSDGTRMPRATRSHVSKYPIIVPHFRVLDVFNNIIESQFTLKHHYENLNTVLNSNRQLAIQRFF